MDPAFAATRRRLSDLKREWERLAQGNQALRGLRSTTDVDPVTMAWLANTALSSGVSSLYTGMEEVLRGILAAVDGHVPSGERSHQDMLDQASVEVAGLRPAILEVQVYDMMTDLKGFRHYERHNYRFRFDEEQIVRNLRRAEELVPLFIENIEAFVEGMSFDAKGG